MKGEGEKKEGGWFRMRGALRRMKTTRTSWQRRLTWKCERKNQEGQKSEEKRKIK